MATLQIDTAKVFAPLLHPSRYKGAFGGRGSGKSHFFAGLLVEDHLRERGLRSVCIREVQKTLKESAKRLIEDKIGEYGLGAQGFRILNDRIETPGGGVIIFVGMADHNAESIKSLEGFGRAWIEEAQTLSKRSMQLLRPTIRAKNSEIWFSWNPSRKSDAVDELLRGDVTPSNSIVVRANWNDNPWLPEELNQERLDDLEQYPDSYEHVWEGGYITAQDGAYFAKVINKAKSEGRIGLIARDPLMTCYAFFDIGGTGAKADACAIWIVQFIGKEIRVLHYYEAQGQELSEHVGWLRRNDYEDAKLYLPHDGVKHDNVFRVTYQSALVQAGFKVEILPNAGAGAANQRIEAVRRVFGRVWIDADKCEGGIESLGWYHEKKDQHRGIGLGPNHDFSSHACLIGSTLISTKTAQKQIKNIASGEYVETPNGYRRVLNAGFVKVSSEIITITLSCGAVLKCTPEHKIFTTNGILLAHNVIIGDVFFNKETSWKSVKEGKGYREEFTGYTMASSTDRGKKGICIAHRLAVSSAFFTELYGRKLTGTFQRILPLFQKIMIGMTFPKAIGSVSRERLITESNTRAFTSAGCITGLSITNGLMATTRTKQPINSYIEMFTRPSLEKYHQTITFIIGMATKATINRPILNACDQVTMPDCTQKQTSGLDQKKTKSSSWKLGKRQSYGTQAKKELHGIEKTERKHGRTAKLTQRAVRFARKITRHFTRISLNSALVVVNIKREKEEVNVYDLTVDVDHCYYANGLLVSNCDAFGAMALESEKLSRARTSSRPAQAMASFNVFD